MTDQLDRLGATRRRGAPAWPTTRPATRACTGSVRRWLAGAIPFSVQGPENAWCLDGGRTIGWEMARHSNSRSRTAARPGVRPGRRRRVRGVCRCRVRDERARSRSSTPCRPRAARRWPGPGRCAGRPAARAMAAAPLGGADVAVGDRTRARSPTASSTTRPTTGSGSFEAMAASGGSPIVAPETDGASRPTSWPDAPRRSRPAPPAPPVSPACSPCDHRARRRRADRRRVQRRRPLSVGS